MSPFLLCTEAEESIAELQEKVSSLSSKYGDVVAELEGYRILVDRQKPPPVSTSLSNSSSSSFSRPLLPSSSSPSPPSLLSTQNTSQQPVSAWASRQPSSSSSTSLFSSPPHNQPFRAAPLVSSSTSLSKGADRDRQHQLFGHPRARSPGVHTAGGAGAGREGGEGGGGEDPGAVVQGDDRRAASCSSGLLSTEVSTAPSHAGRGGGSEGFSRDGRDKIFSSSASSSSKHLLVPENCHRAGGTDNGWDGEKEVFALATSSRWGGGQPLQEGSGEEEEQQQQRRGGGRGDREEEEEGRRGGGGGYFSLRKAELAEVSQVYDGFSGDNVSLLVLQKEERGNLFSIDSLDDRWSASQNRWFRVGVESVHWRSHPHLYKISRNTILS